MQRNGVGTIIFGKHTFLNGRTRFFERERKKDIFFGNKQSDSFSSRTRIFAVCLNHGSAKEKLRWKKTEN